MTSCNLPYFAKEHEEMRMKVREFAREVVAPVARGHERRLRVRRVHLIDHRLAPPGA